MARSISLMEPGNIYETCARGLAEFMRDSGFAEVVIGLSGGLDSSVVATIAVDVLGAQNVHGVLMPGPYSTEHSVKDAKDLAANLNIETFTVPIEQPFEAFANVLEQATGRRLDGLAAENTQARCRMVVCMALSNSHGWVMLNTGNKSEAAMGYSTLYGDTAGAFAPIGGVYKTDVFRMAEWRNTQAKSAGQVPPIPQNVIDKPPSAELSPGQSDEASLGIDYRTLDAILVKLVEEGASLENIIASGFRPEDAQMVANRYAAYEFKRALEPTYPKIPY